MDKYFLRTRQKQILDKLQESGIIRVDSLSKYLNVAPITIRRDLDFLHEQGLLERIHGGALPSKKKQIELSFNQRKQIQVEEKMAIGKATANLIPNHSIVFINSGSTSLEVIKHLQDHQVQIITNNIDALTLVRLAENPSNMELILVGGTYRYQSHSLVGDMALESISNIYSSYTILSVNGIHPEYGVTNSWFQHVSLYKKMINNCKGEVIIVADSTKLGAISNFVCASIDQISTIVTDKTSNKDSLDRFIEMGIKVITV